MANDENWVSEFEASALAWRRRMVRSGEFISPHELAVRLEVTDENLRTAMLAGDVIQVDIDGLPYCPAFYANPTGLTQLVNVTRALGGISSWSKIQFFITPKASLADATPLEALANGSFSQVEMAARAFAER